MKSLNCHYTDFDKLHEFVKTHNIIDSPQTLLQIFTGVCKRSHIQTLLEQIKTILPHINIIGSTTDGEILGSQIDEYSTVLSFTILEKTRVVVRGIKQLKSSFQTAKRLVRSFDNIDEVNLAIVFADGLNSNGEGVLKAFNKLAPHITVAGGLAGDNAQFVETFAFTKDGICGDSIVAVFFYNKDLIVNTAHSFGWEQIGKEFKVTKATENRVYLIDNQTPVELYKKYLGDDMCEQLPATGIEFPLMIIKDGNLTARAVVGVHDDGSLVFAGNIKQGDSVWFGYGNVENILNNTCFYNELSTMSIESIFIYSCMARKRLMGNEIQDEILPLSTLAPVSGFFTYGEFLNVTKNNISTSNQLCNQTMTLLLLSEQEGGTNSLQKIKKIPSGKSTQTIRALSHLISETTKELHELNVALAHKIQQEVEKNRQKDKQLLSQSRLAQMGEMISMIAHQWRQPLAAISATSAGLNIKARLNKLENSMLIESTQKISDYAQHLSQTIDDFRDFYKSNKESRQTSLSEIVQGVLNIIKVSVQNNNIELIVENILDDQIYSYPNEIKQVLLNLIKNAEDAVLDNSVKNPYIKISSYKKSGEYILEIKDNGKGISDSIIEMIFDPYFSTKMQKDGTGLGLYMSKIIIEEHCYGKLSAHNTIDGALFRITLKSRE